MKLQISDVSISGNIAQIYPDRIAFVFIWDNE